MCWLGEWEGAILVRAVMGRSEQGVKPPGARVVGSCKLTNVGIQLRQVLFIDEPLFCLLSEIENYRTNNLFRNLNPEPCAHQCCV